MLLTSCFVELDYGDAFLPVVGDLFGEVLMVVDSDLGLERVVHRLSRDDSG